MDRKLLPHEEEFLKSWKNYNEKNLPSIVELAGITKSGKTTCVNSLRDYCKGLNIENEIISERAGVCPISKKLSFEFNGWAVFSFFKEYLELKDNGVDLIFADRGLFDSLVWLKLMVDLDLVQEKKYQILQEMIETYLQELTYLTTIVYQLSVEKSLHRENKRDVSSRKHSVTNQEILNKYNKVLLNQVKRNKNKFNISIINVSSLSIKEQIFATLEEIKNTLGGD